MKPKGYNLIFIVALFAVVAITASVTGYFLFKRQVSLETPTANAPASEPFEPEIAVISGKVKVINESHFTVEVTPLGSIPEINPIEYTVFISSETVFKQRVLKSSEEIERIMSQPQTSDEASYIVEDVPFEFASLKANDMVTVIGKKRPENLLFVDATEVIVDQTKTADGFFYLPGSRGTGSRPPGPPAGQ